jgi:hypothetical protein
LNPNPEPEPRARRFTIASHPEVQRRIKAELAAAGLLHAGTTNCTTPRQARARV